MNSKRKHGGNRSFQIATGILVVAAVAASFTIWFQGESVLAQGQTSSAVFLPDGKLKLPARGRWRCHELFANGVFALRERKVPLRTLRRADW
jgi:hypothetical protein